LAPSLLFKTYTTGVPRSTGGIVDICFVTFVFRL
jgi:hypothetical protein